jgi:hypothetical protein
MTNLIVADLDSENVTPGELCKKHALYLFVSTMTAGTDDEFEFTDFTEDELREIDLTADAAFAVDVVWPASSSEPKSDATLGVGECMWPRLVSVCSSCFSFRKQWTKRRTI